MTELEFKPENYGHMAGLIYRYDEAHQYYCFMSKDEEKGYIISMLAIDGDVEGQFSCSEDG